MTRAQLLCDGPVCDAVRPHGPPKSGQCGLRNPVSLTPKSTNRYELVISLLSDASMRRPRAVCVSGCPRTPRQRAVARARLRLRAADHWFHLGPEVFFPLNFSVSVLVHATC